MLKIDTTPLTKAVEKKVEEDGRTAAAVAVIAGVTPITADRILTAHEGTSLRKIAAFAAYFGFDVKVEFVPQT